MPEPEPITLEEFKPSVIWHKCGEGHEGTELRSLTGSMPDDLRDFPTSILGTVNAAGEWDWNGEGLYRDVHGEPITQIKAFRPDAMPDRPRE